LKIGAFETDVLMDIAARPPLVFAEGKGSWLIDHRGKHYWTSCRLGSELPGTLPAGNRQDDRGPGQAPDQPERGLLQRRGDRPGTAPVETVRPRAGFFLGSSGAEANEGAIKLARKWGSLHKGGAWQIVTFADAFHGRTLATMSASGKAGWDRLFEPKVPGFPKAYLNDVESVQRLIGPETVAIMVEPIQGEAGVVMAEDDFCARCERCAIGTTCC